MKNNLQFLILGLIAVVVVMWTILRRKQSCRPLLEGYSTLDECARENEHLKMLAKYLILVVRKNGAERELFRMEHGYARVFESPRLQTIHKQIAMMKKQIKSDPEILQFFQENLDLVLI